MHNLVEAVSWVDTIEVPDEGDDASAASLIAATKGIPALANRTQQLRDYQANRHVLASAAMYVVPDSVEINSTSYVQVGATPLLVLAVSNLDKVIVELTVHASAASEFTGFLELSSNLANAPVSCEISQTVRSTGSSTMSIGAIFTANNSGSMTILLRAKVASATMTLSNRITRYQHFHHIAV